MLLVDSACDRRTVPQQLLDQRAERGLRYCHHPRLGQTHEKFQASINPVYLFTTKSVFKVLAFTVFRKDSN